jgi:T5orf172 domain
MMDPWDISPTAVPYFGGGFEELSPEQEAAGKEAHERYCKELRAGWRQKRPKMVQERLRLLRRYQDALGPERDRLRSEGAFRYILRNTCVYLMRCPSITPRKDPGSLFDYGNVFKIGHTDDLDRRTAEHRRPPECGGLDPLIEHHTIYYTPIDRRVLEGLLLRHYKDFRCRSDLNEELFSLPQRGADNFAVVARAIERHLLAVEVIRLKACLRMFKAECKWE